MIFLTRKETKDSMEQQPDGLVEGVAPGYRRLEVDEPTVEELLDFYRDYRADGGEPIKPFEKALREAADGEAA
jgi:hypothetical protein